MNNLDGISCGGIMDMAAHKRVGAVHVFTEVRFNIIFREAEGPQSAKGGHPT